MSVRTRFAPSPTGFLHIGGARTALFCWLFARHHKAAFILRIEDTDEVRSTRESVDAILHSMNWLGLDWDEGPLLTKRDEGWDEKGSHGPYFQMKRTEHYKRYVKQLIDEGKAYPCYCTAEDIDAMRKLAESEKRNYRYDRRCRNLTADERKAREAQGKKFSVRFKMPEDGETVVDDGIRGQVHFDNKLRQDLVIQKTSGVPTYNFANVIDDHMMEVTHVVRGDEHLNNTPEQQQIYSALGFTPPKFAHLSMILGPDGAKLSKRHGATSVLEYRDQGFLPETMRNYLALLGWSTPESQQLFTQEELVAKFGLEGCQKNPATFDNAKLLWMNGEYIRTSTVDRLLEQAKPFLEKAELGSVDRKVLSTAVKLEQEKAKLLSDIPGLVEFFFREPNYDPKAVDKVLKAPGADKVVEELAVFLEKVEPFTEKSLEDAIRKFCEDTGRKTGQVFHPIRVAVSGKTTGPTLFGMLELLGKATVVARLKSAQKLCVQA
ncbi:MAG: glutamate--tRNA ligase [Elusimicrobia bacterium]|nr:glutamate--tRNA ligase [Elusimicrobiota bacterium]